MWNPGLGKIKTGYEFKIITTRFPQGLPSRRGLRWVGARLREIPRRRKTLITNLRPASVLHVRSGLGVCGDKTDFYLHGAPEQQKLHITSS
ncbi:hypothetical protein TNCT_6721 [Trichonephila clavata]|uniref:Uncharacterized protein n=1 Tax=Trichonephila clavata TaxID=2740835 RepID=A0A8X6FPY4_TRICU|nr:hypothetical protein TNCT_6721 [Trichonephila clavata]